MDDAGSVQDTIQRAVEDAERVCGIFILDSKDNSVSHHDNSGILLQDREGGSLSHHDNSEILMLDGKDSSLSYQDSSGIVIADGEKISLPYHHNSGILLQNGQDGLSHSDYKDENQGYLAIYQDHGSEEDGSVEDYCGISRGIQCEESGVTPAVDNRHIIGSSCTNLEQTLFPILKLHGTKVPEHITFKEEEVVTQIECPELVTVDVHDGTRICSQNKVWTEEKKMMEKQLGEHTDVCFPTDTVTVDEESQVEKGVETIEKPQNSFEMLSIKNIGQNNGGWAATVKKDNHTKQSNVCPICSKEFRLPVYLKEHLMTHTGKYPIRCSVCHKACRHQGELVYHMKRSHPIEKRDVMEAEQKKKSHKLHICLECGKGFQTQAHLKEHLRRHAKDYPLRCRICNQGFWRKCKLMEHIKRHHPVQEIEVQHLEPQTGHAPYHLTGKVVEKTQLREKESEGEKQDNNEQSRLENGVGSDMVKQKILRNQLHYDQRCDNEFVSDGHLAEHLVTHNIHTMYPLRCKIGNIAQTFCERSTKQRKEDKPEKVNGESLAEKNVETAEKQTNTFQISSIRNARQKNGGRASIVNISQKGGKGFQRKDNFQEHLRRHAKEWPLRCGICYQGFRTKSKLISHIEKTHSISESNHEPITNFQEPQSKHIVESSHPPEKIMEKTCHISDKSTSLEEVIVRVGEEKLLTRGKNAYKCGWCMVNFRDRRKLLLHLEKCENKREKQSNLNRETATEINDVHPLKNADRTIGAKNIAKAQCISKAKKSNPNDLTSIGCKDLFVGKTNHVELGITYGQTHDNICEMVNPLQETISFSCVPTHDVVIPKDKAGAPVINLSPKTDDAKDPVQSSDSEEETEMSSGDHSFDGVKDLSESRNTAEVTKLNTYCPKSDIAKDHSKFRDIPKMDHPNKVKGEGPSFACEECGQFFGTKRHLSRHIYMHWKQKLHKCLVCKGTFLQEQELVRHLDKHIADSEELLQKTGPKRGLQVHRIYKCGICDKGFLHPDQVYIHIDKHNLTNSLDSEQIEDVDIEVIDVRPVPGDNQKSSVKRTLWRRIREPFTGVKCGMCGEEYESRRLFQKHRCKETDKNHKMCSICGQTYASSQTCGSHLKTHFKITMKEQFHCTLCDRSFNQKAGLIAHNDRWHSEGPKYMCHICGKRLWTDRRHRGHMEMHENQTVGKRERHFKCKLCPKAFMKELALKKHMLQQHSGKFQCVTCSKVFTTNCRLKRHTQVHTGEKPFSCRVCSQAFARKNHLVVHMRRHTGEKPHKCTICDKAFAQQAGLSCHMKTHDKERRSSFLTRGDSSSVT